ncbi:hypothetical protein G6F62_012268 [Rhizopus arrhizus]|nr:hypothetical protein G6F62_012268 [Rhizopus arrhizus]
MRQLRGNRIAMIFQDPLMTLNPVLRIGEQMMETILTHENVSRAQAEERCREALAMVGIPSPEKRLKSYPHEFSGGMRQRVAIAIAMLNKPDLIICDEPTTALDVTIQAQILQLIRQLQEEMHMGVVFITHDMGVVAEVADRVLVMYRGDKVEEGPSEQVFSAPKHSYTKALLSAVPKLGAMEGTDLPARFPVLQVEGQAQPVAEPGVTSTQEVPAAKREPILSVRNLVTRFDLRGGILSRVQRRVHAVEQVSFDLYPGETLSLVGESGCGKSTLGRVVAGLHRQTEGELRYLGQDAVRLRGAEKLAYTLGVQMIFQDPQASLNPRQRLRQILGESLKVHKLAPPAEIPGRIDQALKEVGLDAEYRDRFPHQISGGQRQRLCIARALRA